MCIWCRARKCHFRPASEARLTRSREKHSERRARSKEGRSPIEDAQVPPNAVPLSSSRAAAKQQSHRKHASSYASAPPAMVAGEIEDLFVDESQMPSRDHSARRTSQPLPNIVQAYPRPRSALSLQKPGVAREAGRAPKRSHDMAPTTSPAGSKDSGPNARACDSEAMERLKACAAGPFDASSRSSTGSIVGGIYSNLFLHKGKASEDVSQHEDKPWNETHTGASEAFTAR